MRNKYAYLAVFFFYLLNINSVLGRQGVGEKTTLTGDPKESRSVVGFYIDNEVANPAFLRAVITKREGDNTFHLFTHGRPGQLLLEGEWRDAKQLGSWLSSQLNDRKHLNIYGCNFGYGEEGRAAVAYLKNKLGVTVSASDDITGKDGDWELEVGEQGQETLRIVYEGNLQCTDPNKLLGTCDFDGDGILNNVDIDDDNDGVLDSQECRNRNHLTGNWASTSTGIYESSIGTTGIKARVTFGNYTNFWDAVAPKDSTWDVGCDGTTSGAGALDGKAMLLFRTADNAGASSGTLKIEFINGSGQAVAIDNPLIHFSRVGGGSGGTNQTVTSSEWVLDNGQTWTTLSEDSLNTTNTSFVHSVLGERLSIESSCSTGEGSGTFRVNDNVSVIDFNVRELLNSTTESTTKVDELGFIIEADICTIDSDKDGIPNDKDLDSDGDGCSDAIEGGGNFDSGDVVVSTLPGGNSGTGYIGTSSKSVKENLGTVADASGVPRIANGGQKVGDSQLSGPDVDKDGIAASCDPDDGCTDPNKLLAMCDFDGDGKKNVDDLDDDNDGVLDSQECSNRNHLTGKWTILSTGIYESSIGTTGIKAKVTLGNYTNFWDGTVPNDTTWDATCDATTSGAGELDGKSTLLVTTANNAGGSSGRFKIEFINGSGQAVLVDNPVIHFGRVGGQTAPYSTVTSSEWVLQNGHTWTTLSEDSLNTTNTSFVHSLLGEVLDDYLGSCSRGAGSGTFRVNNNVSVIDFNVRELKNSTTESSITGDEVEFIIETDICNTDSDKDGIPNDKDLDSDGDGCSDAIEGGDNFDSGDVVVSSTLPGGNSGTGYIGTSPNPVKENLGTVVDASGVPTIANGGQEVGDSQLSGPDVDKDGIAASCDPDDGCTNPNKLLAMCDFDGDGKKNIDDLDDDNDGVLDSQECGNGAHLTSNWTNTNTGIYESSIGTTGIKARITLGNYSTFWDGTVPKNSTWDTTCDGTTSEAGILDGKPVLLVTTANNAGGSSGRLKIEFINGSGQAVSIDNPVIHFDRIGGLRTSVSPTTVTSSEWTLQNDQTWSTLSRDDLNTTNISFVHSLLGQVGTGYTTCSTGEGSGTFRVNNNISVIDFNVRQLINSTTASVATVDQLGIIIEADICNTDSDKDGIPNDKDLDSDGDGCTDAFESGVTTLLGIASSEAIAPAPYGENGFSNSVETAAESNIYKGTYTYTNATDSIVANCPKTAKCSDFTDKVVTCTAAASDTTFGKLDCDGDGVINSKECTDGTDPNDPCKYVPTSVTLSRSAAWDTLDCDGDDVPNKTDPDPKDPCKNGYTTMQALCAAITAGADSLGKVDCDGDGVINSKECTDGTDPNDPCKYVPTSVTLSRSAAWDTLDCDGDDVPNKTDPDPKDPCKNGYTTMQALCAAITAGADSLGKVDCDGDGVINSKECTDGTDPNDPCKYVPTSVTLSRSAAWDTLDCDGDDVPNKTDPDPKDPCKNGYTTFTQVCAAITAGADSLGKVDCDGDGVINSKECTDGTDPNDPCKYVPTSVTLSRSAAWDTLDCDGDDVPNKTDPDPKDPCKNTYTTMQALCAAITAGADSLGKVDCDGDGVINSKECTDGTDPNDPCKYVPTSVTLGRSAAWDTLDCDGDDVPNKTDPDPKDPCKNGYTTMQALCAAITAGADSLGKVDCDGDGVINSKECTDGTDPNDPCKYVPTSVTLAKSAAWDTLDCDGDDVPNKTDPDPKDPCKNGYTTMQALCAAITAGADSLGKVDCDGDGVINSKECTDGTDPNDPCKYVPTSVTLSRSAAWDTLDCDGDDVPNKTDPDPKDPCKNTYTTMQALCAAITAGADSLGKLDCDGDGVINKTECVPPGGGPPTDPTKPCIHNVSDRTLSPTADLSGCCPTITNDPLVNDHPTVCGSSNGTIKLCGLSVSTSGYTLSYVLNGGTAVLVSGQSSNALGCLTLSNLVSGSYTQLLVKSSSCMGSNQLSASLSDPDSPNIGIGSKIDPSLCGSADGSFTLTGLAPGTTYKLSYNKDGVPQTSFSFTSTSTSFLLSGLTAGLYTDITVTSNGCRSNTQVAELKDPTGARITSTASSPSGCQLSDATMTINGLVSGVKYTFIYSKDGIDQQVFSHTATSSSYKFEGLNAGDYHLKVRSGNCNSNEIQQVISDPGSAVIAATGVNPTLCDATDGSYTITGLTEGLTYTLNFVKDGIPQGSTNFTASSTSHKISGLSAGVYSGINVTQGGCKSNTIQVNLTDPAGTQISAIGYAPSSCSANDGRIQVVGLIPGVSYILKYSKEGVTQTDIPFTATGTSFELQTLVSAKYTNIRVDQASCISNSESVDFTCDPCLITFTDKEALCNAIATTPGLGACDYDKDKIPNKDECTPPNGTPPTDPLEPCSNPYDTKEKLCMAITAGADSLGKVDCDGDGVPNKDECTPPNGTPPTDPLEPCSNPYDTKEELCMAITEGVVGLISADCDGDGVTNKDECTPPTGTPPTDPLEPCDFNAVDITKPVVTLPGRCGATLNLKVMLQGALLGNSTGIMRDDLRKNKVIPSKEPYTILGGRFQHVGGGGESLGSTALDDRGNDSVVDWVFVELRDGADTSKVVQTVSALVQRDGDVVSATDGTSSLTFLGRVGQKHFVSVRHRNHLGAMTSSAITLASTGTVVDFTTLSSANAFHLQKSTPKYDGFEQTSILGVNALWAGNVNNDRKVKNSGVSNDRIPIFVLMNNTTKNPGGALNTDKIFPVYMQEDVNMDAKVKYNGTGNDPSYIFTNVVSRYKLNTAANANYDLFVEQLP